MGSRSIPSSVPSSVPSASNTVPISENAQLGPYQTFNYEGDHRIPIVPRTPTDGQPPANPVIGATSNVGSFPASGEAGSPSVPTNGYLFKRGPIDPHYTSEYNPNIPNVPRTKINNPVTRGFYTLLKSYQNYVAHSQDVNETGWKQNSPQQRTSFRRVTLPPRGNGYSPQSYVPRQLPQRRHSYQIVKSTGNDAYGTGVLNSDSLGAGQVSGGIGGNLYSPTSGPPSTNPSTPANNSGMPTWG